MSIDQSGLVQQGGPQQVYVKNGASSVTKGQPVYVTGSNGTNIIIGLAGNASEATSSKTLGLVAQNLAANAFGWVTVQGKLAGLDTSAGADGDPVWLGTSGALIYGLANKPYAPAHLVSIGIVSRSNNSNGEIEVRVQNGFELHEIHDVDTKTSAPTSGQYLKYNGSLWVNSAIAPADVTGTAVITTDSRLSDARTPTSHVHSGADITSGAVGSAYGGVPTGALFQWTTATAPTGYLLCDGSSLSTTGTYANLYGVIGYTYGGSGASFNLPDLRARFPVGYQAPISLGTATITIAAPGVVTRASHGLATGQIVYFTTTGALPTGITATTGRYWVIVLTSSTFRLATSQANALAGTAITTSGTQSGTHTVFSADFELGRSNGEKNHTQTLTELVSHNHSNLDGNSPTLLSAAGGNYGVEYSASTTGNTGGGLPMNIMPPYITLNYIIKI